jgi:hypothetical protein
LLHEDLVAWVKSGEGNAIKRMGWMIGFVEKFFYFKISQKKRPKMRRQVAFRARARNNYIL